LTVRKGARREAIGRLSQLPTAARHVMTPSTFGACS
jgi:hypothetical protein